MTGKHSNTAKTGLDRKLRAFVSDMRSGKIEVPLFDRHHYRRQLPAFDRQVDCLLSHYLVFGEQQGISPHPIYDRAYVLEQITHDYGAEKITADGFSAFHFIQKIQISPSRLFDASLYLENLKTGEHKVPAKTENPASHFLASWPAGVNFSKYFDIPFYDINNPHVANSGSNPLDHYFRTPDNERTDVNPMFHSGYYLLSYKPEGTDPLVHFLDQGHAALNLPNPYARQELLSDGFVTPQNLLNYIKVRS